MKMIEIIQGKHSYLISDEDIEKVRKYKWYKDIQSGYWFTKINDKKLYLHRYITNNNTKNPTDHISGDKNDNTRENLRICTRAVNARNQRIKSNNETGYRNIFKSGKKYILQACVNGKTKTFGIYDTIEDALKDKLTIWKEQFNIDYTEEIYRATMDIFGLDTDIQEIVLDEFFGDDKQ